MVFLHMFLYTPARALKTLVALTAFLGFVNLVLIAIQDSTGGEMLPYSYVLRLNGENTLPSWFSTLLLAAAASLLWLISVLSSAYPVLHWRFLSFLFFGLSLDEAVSIHERFNTLSRLGGPLGSPGIFYYSWVLVAFPLLGILALLYGRFLLHLPARTRTLFLLSAFLYVGGAVGMEMVGGLTILSDGWNVRYELATVVEEMLELFGVSLFIYALLLYLYPLLQHTPTDPQSSPLIRTK